MSNAMNFQAIHALSLTFLALASNCTLAGMTTSMPAEELTNKTMPPTGQHQCALIGPSSGRIAPEKVLPTLQKESAALPAPERFATISALCSGPTGLNYYTCVKAASGKTRCSVSPNIPALKGS